MRKQDISLAKELFRSLFECEKAQLTIELFEKACDSVKMNERCRLYYAYALAKEGNVELAEEILCGKDGRTYLIVPDIREAETVVTDLWFYIQKKKGVDKEQIGEPPQDLDFRMKARSNDWKISE